MKKKLAFQYEQYLSNCTKGEISKLYLVNGKEKIIVKLGEKVPKLYRLWKKKGNTFMSIFNVDMKFIEHGLKITHWYYRIGYIKTAISAYVLSSEFHSKKKEMQEKNILKLKGMKKWCYTRKREISGKEILWFLNYLYSYTGKDFVYR